MKKALLLLSFFFVLFSCQKGEQGTFSSAESSNKHLLERFPMLGKELIKIKEVSMETLSISLYHTPNHINKVLTFRKKDSFYSIPIFPNSYFDYWEFNEKLPQKTSKTGTTFDKEIKSVFKKLELTTDEINILGSELMKSIWHTEFFLEEKPKLFEKYNLNFGDNSFVEEFDSCLARNEKIYHHILDTNKDNHLFFLDNENSRVYEWIYNPNPPYNLVRIKAYRTDCFSSIEE